MMTFRHAGRDDVGVLAELNHQLIQDEGHRNQMTVPELKIRMTNWLAAKYRAVLFEQEEIVVAYALYRPEGNSTYLRQFFVRRDFRRRGLGRAAMKILLTEVLGASGRVYLDVLVNNTSGWAFWKAVGFEDYAVTLEIVRPAGGRSSTL